MIEYRSFRNSDPPRLVRLWHACDLGRGAALGFSCDALESLIFGQTYFDRQGLIVAVDADRIVGFVHASFGANPDEKHQDTSLGVICIVMVHPEFRRQGIGRELISRAEAYLAASGTSDVTAGPARPRDPFYLGLYGGAQSAGFLESDHAAAPFFTALGYEPTQRNRIYQRDLSTQRDPVNFKLTLVRRKTEVVIADQPEVLNWWWVTHLGRLGIESLEFLLIPKGGGETLAKATVIGLDFFIQRWQQRSAGLVDLFVPENERRNGYAQTLLVEIGRRLRGESIGMIEVHTSEDDEVSSKLAESIGFAQVDSGIVYRKRIDSSAKLDSDTQD